MPPGMLANHTAGLIALSGCRRGEIAAALLRGDAESALAAGRRYREWFGPDNFWIELQHHLLPEDDRRVAQLVALANKLGVGYVATNNVHTATRAGQPLQDVLTGIRHLTPLSRAGALLRPNSESYLKVDINQSKAKYALEAGGVRLGFTTVAGFGNAASGWTASICRC